MTRLTNTFVMTLALAAGFATAACGDDDDDGDGVTIDAAPGADVAPTVDAGTPDATPDLSGCGELTAPVGTISTVPGTYVGDLTGATAGLSIGEKVTCDTQVAPDGVATVGVDEVVKVTGLTAGTTYHLRLTAGEDLSIYVLTGCTEGELDGPAQGECLSFADQTFGVGSEALAFVAPEGGEVSVVVDFWLEDTVADPAYTLDLSAAEGCVTAEECTEPAAPICELGTGECVDRCEDDDAAEATDDTQEGATALDLSRGPVTTNANICQNAALGNELDFYSFTVADGGFVEIDLAWEGDTADLDLEILNQDGTVRLGLSYYQNPEIVQLTYLPAGTYYIQINRFAPDDSSDSTPYILTVTPQPVTKCTSDANCGEVFEKQFFRADCNTTTGACVELVGAGAVALGGICDSDDDCVEAATFCGNLSFTAEPHLRSVCTLECTMDADCAGVNALAKCTVGSDANFCALPCTSDDQCAVLGGPLSAGDAWLYGSCTAETGVCDLTPPM